VLIVAMAGGLAVSCTGLNSRRWIPREAYIPSSPRARPAPPALDLDPPALALNHVPVKDPALALVYQNPEAPEFFVPRREGRRSASGWIEQMQARQVESWKQPAVPQQAEELLLEELLQLNLDEDSKIPITLRKLVLTTQSELPLTLNEQVMRYVNYFLRRGRNTLRESLRRAGAYRPMISRALSEHGLPAELIYLVQAESGFRPTARSPKRATGMWQFVSWRGKEYGLNQNRHVDERLDPEKATYAAARHLSDLHAQFGNWYLAMAAYNCGPVCVQRAVERTGYADYWEFVSRGVIPRETANYVPVILAMALLAKNPEVFALDDVVPEPAIHYDTVTTHSRISILLISDLTGATPARIKQLNPALLGQTTPESTYALRIPKGTAERFEQEIALIPESRRASWRRHEVRPGEALPAIAARYRVKVEELAALNQLASGELEPAQRLTIPVAYRTEPVRRPGSAPGRSLGPQYTVRQGDTLGAIARRYGVTVAQLQQWNGLRTTRLSIGRVLAVQSRPATRQVASRSR
jgi:membrane-bound lytic murein transglycosylase D